MVFDGYLNGLRTAGWHDDPRNVRFAYAAAAPLIFELGCAALVVDFLTEHDDSVKQIEQMVGRTIDELIPLWVQTLGFRLRLAAEARTILDSISEIASVLVSRRVRNGQAGTVGGTLRQPGG
jgi:hypothetical protein